MERVTDPHGPFSFLEQRFQYTERNPQRRFLNLVDNVPKWINGFPVEFTGAEGAPHYESCFGMFEIRETIANIERRKCAGIPLQTENVLMTQGAMHGLAHVFRSLRDERPTFVVQSPVFGMVPKILRRIGYRVVPVDARCGELDREQLEMINWKEVAGVYLHSPANPSGDVLSEKSLRKIADLCNEFGCACVVDSVYDRFVFDGADTPSVLGIFENWDNLFLLNSMSKGYGAPGLRVGWIISGKQSIVSLADVLEQEIVSISGISQKIALNLLESGAAQLQHTVQHGRAEVLRLAEKSENVFVVTPKGGTQVLVEVPIGDVDDFADWALVKQALVLVTNSHFEGIRDRSVVRFPIGDSIPFIRQAFAALEDAVEQYLYCGQGRSVSAEQKAVGV